MCCSENSGTVGTVGTVFLNPPVTTQCDAVSITLCGGGSNEKNRTNRTNRTGLEDDNALF